MSWNVQGRYFENCSCEAPCPCVASMTLGADYDRCKFVLAFHVDSGEVEGIDVSGLSVAVVGDTPKRMDEGGWRLGLLIDQRASGEQAEKLAGVFSGQLGGPMQALAPLLGEVLGIEQAPIEFAAENGHHTLEVGGAGRLEVDDVVPFGVETGEPARLAGIFHPVSSELTIAKSGGSRFSAFGIEPELAGKSAFSSPFSWSA